MSHSSISSKIQHALIRHLLLQDRPRVGPFVVVVDRSSDNPFRNYAVPDGEASDADVAALTVYFHEHERVPRLEYVEPNEALSSALHRAGYRVERRLQLLALDRPVEPPPVDGLTVGAGEDLPALAAVMGRAYGDDEPVSDGAARLERTVRAGGYVVSARLDGRVVSGGLHTAAADGRCEIAAVATDEPYRRRGIAAQVVAELTRHAFDAGLRPFLQAESEAEARIYRRIGYVDGGALALVNGPSVVE